MKLLLKEQAMPMSKYESAFKKKVIPYLEKNANITLNTTPSVENDWIYNYSGVYTSSKGVSIPVNLRINTASNKIDDQYDNAFVQLTLGSDTIDLGGVDINKPNTFTDAIYYQQQDGEIKALDDYAHVNTEPIQTEKPQLYKTSDWRSNVTKTQEEWESDLLKYLNNCDSLYTDMKNNPDDQSKRDAFRSYFIRFENWINGVYPFELDKLVAYDQFKDKLRDDGYFNSSDWRD